MPAPRLLLLVLMVPLLGGCRSVPGSEAPRRGDEIMVCGRLFHTGAPVVLWTDPGGYDAYRTEKRFVPWDKAAWTPPAPGADHAEGPASPNRSNIRFASSVGKPGCPLSADDFERIRGGGWDLPTLQRCVDQFVLHYDACGTSRQCFRILHDVRGLSVHFMLDLDGTIYQTLDVKERAWHATTSNDRAVGIEIANIGAYPSAEAAPLKAWYGADERGTVVTIPNAAGDGGLRTRGFVARPARPGPVMGEIQGQTLCMYDLTPRQYDSLVRLTATLCTVLPGIACDYPRDETGRLVTSKLTEGALENYRGLLGHYHLQSNKVDPGPALQWEMVVERARLLMGPPARAERTMRPAAGETVAPGTTAP